MKDGCTESLLTRKKRGMSLILSNQYSIFDNDNDEFIIKT
jgi:hypothetical protein